MSNVVNNLLNSEDKGITVALSTSHVDFASLAFLETRSKHGDDTRIAARHYGYFIKLAGPEVDNYADKYSDAPAALIRVLSVAQKAGVSVLELDEDGPLIDGLPEFDHVES